MHLPHSLKQIGLTAASAAIGLVALNATSADAFTVYTDRAAWEAAISGATITTETFDNDIPIAPTITFDTGVVSTGVNGIGFQLVALGVYQATVEPTGLPIPPFFDEIRWQFPSPIVAFGADWLGVVEASGLTLSGNFDGTGEETVSLSNILGNSLGGFLGIVGEAPFSEVIIREEGSISQGINVDNLSFSDAPPSQPVPEPSTLLALLSVTGAGIALKRRQTSSNQA